MVWLGQDGVGGGDWWGAEPQPEEVGEGRL